MAPGQRNCQAEAETPVTSLLAAHIWKHKGTSDAFISSMWLPPGDQEGGKHNDKQSQDTQAHCNGSYFAVSIRKAFFFWKEKEIRACYSRMPYSYTVHVYSRKVGKCKPEVLKTLLSSGGFFFPWTILTTFFICAKPHLKKIIVAPSTVALCFPREWLFSLTSAGIVSALSTHTAGAFFPKADGEHHSTKCQSENKVQDILHGPKLLLCDIWLLLPSEEYQARDRNP